MAMFSDGGRQPYGLPAMRDYVALSVVVALVLPATRRALRFGALLSAVLLAATYYAASPLGGNVLRLPMLFAIPVVAAYVPWRTWVLITALLIIVWWRPPINVNDVRHAGDPETKASFYQPLVSELSGLGPLGRIEVVPLRAHWESTYLAERVPLARGWLRQADIARNPGFYRASPMTAAEYDTWLHTNAVSYVAAAIGQPLDSAATTEAAIVSSAPSYLRAIWHRGAWTLYRVIDAAPFVTGAQLVSADAGTVTFEAPGPGRVGVRVRWSSWLVVTGAACAMPSTNGWTQIDVPKAGRYTLRSSPTGGC
jgi:hypothetical protein